jgi:dimethylsulfoniopropionate demethylase
MVIGIAMIQKSHWEVSQTFKIQINDTTINGKVCDLPFI